MIFQKHAIHGHHIAYSPQEAKSNEDNGWVTVSKEEFYDRGQEEVEEPEETEEPEDIPRSVLEELYTAKFGKKPHHRTKNSTIKEKLNADNT